MYDHMVAFYTVFFKEISVVDCILPSDGFSSVWSKGRGTPCLYSMKKGELPVLWVIVLFISNSVYGSASNYTGGGLL